MMLNNKTESERKALIDLKISPEINGVYYRVKTEDPWKMISWRDVIMRDIGLKTLPMALEIVLLDFIHNELKIEAFNDHEVMIRKVESFVKKILMKEVS